MAHIRIKDGPADMIGRELQIMLDRDVLARVFQDLLRKECFWTIDLSGLSRDMRFEVRLIDFTSRCTRALAMNIPLFFNDRVININCASKDAIISHVDSLINLFTVSGSDVRFKQDNKEGLYIEAVPDENSIDFYYSIPKGNA